MIQNLVSLLLSNDVVTPIVGIATFAITISLHRVLSNFDVSSLVCPALFVGSIILFTSLVFGL